MSMLVRKSCSDMIIDYDISQVRSYINWEYFLHAWGMLGRPESDRQKVCDEGQRMLDNFEGHYRTHALFVLFNAHSDGDDVLVSVPSASTTVRIPFLRQQMAGSEYLCLADFVHPQYDRIGLFATSVDHGMETDFDDDPYEKMMAQLLADRLAEATAECMHEVVRKHYWGYAPDEHLSVRELWAGRYQGIRPAVGYPSLPDASMNFLIDQLIGLHQIGIRLTESGAMRPHASVSGLMLAHPQAHYFTIGPIASDQLHDYSRRRGLPVEVMRRFLCPNDSVSTN